MSRVETGSRLGQRLPGRARLDTPVLQHPLPAWVVCAEMGMEGDGGGRFLSLQLYVRVELILSQIELFWNTW